jgi:16S rRNA A1518/A1519 N6-dimethyltransferase RsmA/KsgA/DIM1 with predicted DNA glycosylase/AP lyase activity
VDDPAGLLAELGIDPQRRGETLEPAMFVRLAAALAQRGGVQTSIDTSGEPAVD